MGPSTRGQLQGPPQKRPPIKGAAGNSWEWEWKLTDSLNNIQVTPELENQAIQAAENAVARMTRTDDGLETLVPGPSMVPSEGGDGVVRPSGAYGVTPSPEPESLWGKASSTEATSSHPVAANSRRDQTPPGENTRLTHHQETPQGPLRTDRDGQTSSAGVVQEGSPEFGGSERGRDTDGQETVPVSPSSEQQSRVVTPHRPTGPHRAHREGVLRFGVGILLGLLLFALGFALGMLYLKSQRSEADAQSAALIEEDAGRLAPTAMDGAQ